MIRLLLEIGEGQFSKTFPNTLKYTIDICIFDAKT